MDELNATKVFTSWGIGRLGASATGGVSHAMLVGAQTDMIERRILRIEAALRQAGIDIDALDIAS
jgi:hypothetical protein